MSTPDNQTEEQPNQPDLIGRILCMLGLHDYRVEETTFGFGGGGSVEKDRCRRCGKLYTHKV